VGRFASLGFRPKNMAHHIFQLETELQNIPEKFIVAFGVVLALF